MIFIYAYLILMFIRPQDWVGVLLGLPVLDFVLPPALVYGIYTRQRIENRRNLPQYYLLVAYLLIIFVSTWANCGHFIAYYQFIWYLKSAVVFYIVFSICDTPEKLSKVLGFTLLMSVILSFQSISQQINIVGWAGQEMFTGGGVHRIRWVGLWDGPNVLALVFLLGLSISIEYALGPFGKSKKLIGLFCSAFIFYGLMSTNSRGGILAFVVMISFLLFEYFRKEKTKAIVVGILIAGAVFALMPSRMSEITTKEKSAYERTWLWEQGLNMLREKPILGVGKGQFVKHTDGSLVAHSNYVKNFSELGLVGFFVWLSLLYISFKGVLQVSRLKIADEGDELSISMSRSLILALLSYCAATYFVDMDLDIFYFLLALYAVIVDIHQREGKINLKIEVSDFFYVVAGMIIIISSIWFFSLA